MNIIKLNAINSTNDYLKQLTATRHVEHFTIVVAENQTQGRGQMGSVWNAEPGKNLTFSVLVKDLLLQINQIFSLNVAVAVSIAQALETFNIPQVSIKWPNDILAGNKKVGGILIENSIKNDGEIFSVIGIGLNVNQQNFDGLPKASSLAVATGRVFDKEAVMMAIAEQLNRNLMVLMHKDAKTLWDNYHQKLYKKGLPMPFDKNGKTFMGIIQGVNHNGCLQVVLADDSVAEYNIKEVQLLY